jgi:hypothetical protein
LNMKNASKFETWAKKILRYFKAFFHSIFQSCTVPKKQEIGVMTDWRTRLQI